MRFLREAALAVLLLACNDDASTPTQPAAGDSPADPELLTAAVDGSTTTTISPTRGFFVGNGPTGAAISLGTGFSVIQKISLPPGSYVATGMAVVAATDPKLRSVDCSFAVGGLTRGQLARGMVGGGINTFATIPNTIVFTIAETKNLSLACRADVADHVVSQPSPLTAIKVNSVTVVRE